MSPIDELRSARPDLFAAPDFWRTTLGEISETVSRLEREGGQVETLGQSAGGRDIFAVSWGAREQQRPTATISSANASDRPEAFFDRARRSKPALVLVGPIHGGEMEGIAVLMNLIEVIATGNDLPGRDWARLQALCRKVRLSVIPCMNPDGRERAGVKHLNGADVEHVFLTQQGVMKDGSLFRGRVVKEVQPVPDDYLQWRGGYYNDSGVNLQHDDFFGPELCPENRALARFFRKELPDGFLALHSHGGACAFTAPDAFLSPGYQRKQSEAAFYIMSRLTAAGIEPSDPAAATGPPWSFYFQTFFSHATGALPLLLELPHGLASCPFPMERIVEIGLIAIEGWMDFALRYGLRPAHPAFYGPPPKA